MKERPDDYARVRHIIDAISEIRNYTAGYSLEQFGADSKTRFATIKQLEIIGEACNSLSESLIEKYPDIPFQQIISLRHILVHEYYGISNQILWNILSDFLNDYETKMKKVPDELSED